MTDDLICKLKKQSQADARRIKELEGALLPFAKIARDLEIDDVDVGSIEIYVDVDDLRYAYEVYDD